jgi:hypothetical protein
MEGIFKAFAGNAKVEHIATYLDGRIGVGYNKHIDDNPVLNVADLTEEEQAAGVIYLGGILRLATSQDEKEIETELVSCIEKACVAKEAVAEIKE